MKNTSLFFPSVGRRARMFRPVKTVMRPFLYILLMLTLLLSPAPAQEEKQTADPRLSPDQMVASLENALVSHRAELNDLKARVQQLEAFQNAFLMELETYESQNTIHRQLLLTPQLRIEDLEYAVRINQLASKALSVRIEKFQKQWGDTAFLFQSADDRIELARKQIDEIRQYPLSDDQKRHLDESTETLLLILRQKQQFGKLFLNAYEDIVKKMEAVRDAQKAIGEQLAMRLETQKKATILTRATPYHDLTGHGLSEDLAFFLKRITSALSYEVWVEQWQQIKMSRMEHWVAFLAMLTVAIAFRRRWRIALERFEEKYKETDWHYLRLGLLLLRNSLLCLSLMALFAIYNAFNFSLLNIGLGRVMLQLFSLLLMTRWGIDYLNYVGDAPAEGKRAFVFFHLKRLFRFYRISGIIVILLIWIAGMDSLLIWMILTVFLIILLIWAIRFWLQMKKILIEDVRKGQARSKWITGFSWWIYFVIDIALILNLIGYDTMALLWISSWIETIVLLFWGWLTLNIIREWQKNHEAGAVKAGEEDSLSSAHHWRWTQIKLIRLLWLFTCAALILHVWDPLGVLRTKLGYIIQLPLTIGTLQFSIKGIVMSGFILFITHLGVRLGRAFLTEKILDKHAFETGLKDSILTITSYLCWGIALLLALSILGVNATSLAVVFGALSVGIGFGLQNIVNNFISGLILLFERPIQVGDTVEVEGLWATVKKINVRATVVQTFDNAILIIPNSEFISKQVTNWSMGDRRLRRNIEVGVAYGSDIELVQKTMLETALEELRVLRFPRPDVLFIDHGPSALIFRLRVWVHEDDYWNVPSRIRCEIDRRFRELNIEIAFPQQDVHIRTLPEKMLTPMVDKNGQKPDDDR